MNALTTLALALALAQAPGSAPAPSARAHPPRARPPPRRPSRAATRARRAGAHARRGARDSAETQNLDPQGGAGAAPAGGRALLEGLVRLPAAAHGHRRVHAQPGRGGDPGRIARGRVARGHRPGAGPARRPAGGDPGHPGAAAALRDPEREPRGADSRASTSRERGARCSSAWPRRTTAPPRCSGRARSPSGCSRSRRARRRTRGSATRPAPSRRSGSCGPRSTARGRSRTSKRSQNSFASARIALATLLDRPPDFEVVIPPEPVLAAEAAAMEEAALRIGPTCRPRG